MKTSFGILLLFILLGLISCDQENEGIKQFDLQGKVIYKSSCKSGLLAESGPIDLPDTISRIEYSYNRTSSKLTIRHINTGFNCCADSIYCNFSVSGDTLLIKENEKHALCNCDCLYDLEMEIDSVNSKKYQVRFIEPYADDQEPLLFEMDLTEAINGSFSVVRKQYPWGGESIRITNGCQQMRLVVK